MADTVTNQKLQIFWSSELQICDVTFKHSCVDGLLLIRLYVYTNEVIRLDEAITILVRGVGKDVRIDQSGTSSYQAPNRKATERSSRNSGYNRRELFASMPLNATICSGIESWAHCRS